MTSTVINSFKVFFFINFVWFFLLSKFRNQICCDLSKLWSVHSYNRAFFDFISILVMRELGVRLLHTVGISLLPSADTEFSFTYRKSTSSTESPSHYQNDCAYWFKNPWGVYTCIGIWHLHSYVSIVIFLHKQQSMNWIIFISFTY